jgi:hypothetical protein
MPGVPRHVAGNLAPLLAHRRRVKEVNQRSFLRRAVAHGTQNTHIWIASMMIETERRSAQIEDLFVSRASAILSPGALRRFLLGAGP